MPQRPLPDALAAKADVALARLQAVCTAHARPTYGTAFGPEGVVLLHLISEYGLPVAVFSLDTLRLPKETLELWSTLESRLKLKIARITAAPLAIESLVASQGTLGMYESLENRKACCNVRKVVPLSAALADKDAWITGLRQTDSPERSNVGPVEFDAHRALMKYNPLFDWTDAEVFEYLAHLQLPVNALHAKGYPSIGCEPCTRAVRPGEPTRAGRWWWEQADSKECGLHVSGTHRTISITVADRTRAVEISSRP